MNLCAAKINRLLLIWLMAVAFLGAAVFPYARRTLIGEMISGAFTGRAPAQQWALELGDDVQNKKSLAPLQEWAVQTLQSCRDGKLKTSGKPSYWTFGTLEIAPQELPAWLTNAWKDNPPEIVLKMNETNSNEPECVGICWYGKGLLVGTTNFNTDFHPYFIYQVKPGIYAYSVEK